jgi:HEPN domain-containing protein
MRARRAEAAAKVRRVTEDFATVARTRRGDAGVLHQNGRTQAALYMAGYAVECSLKALLEIQKKPIPRSSRGGGHDLRTLWKSSGLRARDLGEQGERFVAFWSTSLRYQTELPGDHEELFKGAGVACTFLSRLHKREAGRAKRRSRR